MTRHSNRDRLKRRLVLLGVLWMSVLPGVAGCSGHSEVGSELPSGESPGSEPAHVEIPRVQEEVSFVFSKPEYVFTLAEVAAGISIEYELVVNRELADLVPLRQGSAGEVVIASKASDAAFRQSLIPFESISGHGQRYGLFDTGLGPPRTLKPGTIIPGSSTHHFEWDGRNWNGGSDTSVPKGAPFPAGTYTLTISCVAIRVLPGGNERVEYQGHVEVRLTK